MKRASALKVRESEIAAAVCVSNLAGEAGNSQAFNLILEDIKKTAASNAAVPF
jgi:hypothetical protein